MRTNILMSQSLNQNLRTYTEVPRQGSCGHVAASYSIVRRRVGTAAANAGAAVLSPVLSRYSETHANRTETRPQIGKNKDGEAT